MILITVYCCAMKNKPENKRLFLGRRIHAIRKAKGWTQEELGVKADVSYKFIGEIERGQQNPSFDILVKIAGAIGVELHELFQFEQEIKNRKDIEDRVIDVVKGISEEDLRKLCLVLNNLFPHL